jgi:glycosyltransferase involved in cell wall biosynthesis
MKELTYTKRFDPEHVRYVVITPARDEESFLPETIASVAYQSVQPLEWVIVNDGSSDRTREIAEEAARGHSFIRVVHREDRGTRDSDQGMIEAFEEGLRSLSVQNYQFVCKMDADLGFGPDYFRRLFRAFSDNPRLGIASGVRFTHVYRLFSRRRRLLRERISPDSVLPSIKLYRRECFEQIGGLTHHFGWSGIDVLKAQMRGWVTGHIPDLAVIHLRRMTTTEGLVRENLKAGWNQYLIGSHPLFVVARSVYRMTDRPYVVNGLAILLGYLRAMIEKAERIDEPEFVSFVRESQLKRLGLKP